MEMRETVLIPAPRVFVWQSLNDPDILRQCIPGCEELKKMSPTALSAKVVIKVGPIKARFSGDVMLRDLDPPRHYVLSGEGRGGVAGFANGTAVVTLEEISSEQTALHYEARVDVGGKIAQLGARFLDSTAQRLTRQFFDVFTEVVSNRSDNEDEGKVVA